MITYERASELMTYNPGTGDVRWRSTSCEVGVRRKGGEVVGCADHRGALSYRRVAIDGRRYYAHQLAWLLLYREWPASGIDHVNNDGLDNRSANLRLACQTLNNANARRRKDNSSGHRGVSFYKAYGKWEAYINSGGKRVRLGYFDSRDDAIAAYQKAAQQTFGAYAKGSDGLAALR